MALWIIPLKDQIVDQDYSHEEGEDTIISLVLSFSLETCESLSEIKTESHFLIWKDRIKEGSSGTSAQKLERLAAFQNY